MLAVSLAESPSASVRVSLTWSFVPEIRPELHRGLVEWMLFRAYSRQDTDLYNDAKAAIALGRFEAEFGRKTSGRNEEWVRRGSDPMPGPIA